MSASPGSTLIPSVEMTRTPAGSAISLRRPTAVMRSPAMRITPFSIGGPP